MAKDPDEDPIVRGYPDPSDVLAELRDKLSDVCDRLTILESKGAGTIRVLNDGIDLGADIGRINVFGGNEVEAVLTGTDEATFFHPSPTFSSHWNTSDGNNGNQTVTESFSRVNTRISSPTSEGNPFKTGGWAGTNQATTTETQPIFTTPGEVTGFGGDSTVLVEVLDADGATVIDSFSVASITGNLSQTSPSGHIDIVISNFAPDLTKYKAKLTVTVRVLSILSGLGLDGGKYNVRITHTTDSATDGSQTFIYTQPEVFLDTNPNTPSISGVVGLVENTLVTKRLSGLRYYTLGSSFNISVSGIDQLNRNTQRVDSNLLVDADEYGISQLAHSPFGVGSANFSGWTNDYNNNGTSYLATAIGITQPDYRLMSPTASISSTPQDPWGSGSSVASGDSLVMIDTYSSASTDTFEDFVDEDRREFIDGVGAAASTASFPGAGLWPSASSLSTLAFSPAAVFDGKLMVPNQTYYVRTDGSNSPNSDWSSFNPTGSFNYSLLGPPVNYARRFTQASSNSIPNFIMTFSGTFAAGDALADLVSGNLEIYVYRIAVPAGTVGAFGKPPSNTQPLRVHLEFGNPAPFDDGLTVNGSGIRTASSSGNTITCSLGFGTPAQTGVYCHFRILNSGTTIDSVALTFP